MNRGSIIEFPFVRGLDTQSHDYAIEPPGLSACKNAVFTELGGIQKRRPYTAKSTNILGGGTIANIRRIAAHDGELLAFTDTELYSWSASDSKWVLKGDHLAIKTTERSRFIRTTEQIDCDRAELSNVIVYAWMDKGDQVYIAAIDKTTGCVLLAPTAQGAGTERPRLVALTNKILLFVKVSGDPLGLKAKPLGPTTLATDAAAAFTTVSSVLSAGMEYDVVKFDGTNAIAVVHNTSNTYEIHKVTEAIALTSLTKARVCESSIAVAVSAASDIMVIRGDDTNQFMYADQLDSAMADVTVSTNLGSYYTPGPLLQVAAEFRSVQNGGEYRCYVFWDEAQGDLPTPYVTYIDTGGTKDTAAVFQQRAGVASRAFDHNGVVYVWLVAAPTNSDTDTQLQNTYYLYGDDGVLVAKATAVTAGGYPQSNGHLPGVASLGSNQFAWCGSERRRIELGSAQKGYAARGLRDVVFEFDSDDARRTVQLGRTVYISGGQILQFDGEGLTEVGFHLYPFWMGASDSGSAGNLEAGTYSWKRTVSWANAKGEFERSTTASIASATIAASKKANVAVYNQSPTLKISPRATAAIEIWRTLKNPVDTSPFYLATDKDPTATGDNGYLTNDPTAGAQSNFVDNFADATLDDKEVFPENGFLLESIAPPAATIVHADSDRLYLAGIAHNPLEVHYSKLRGQGEIASFHDALVVTLPAHGGDITGLAHLNNTLIVFKEQAIYALPGTGFDNFGQGQNFGPPQLIANDVGAKSHDVIATTPKGLMFMSDKGWYLLGRDWSPQYIGGKVNSFDSDTWVNVHVLEDQHQVRCTSTSRVLMYDFIVGEWSEWEIASAVGATIWDGTWHYATGTAVSGEDSGHGGTTGYALQVATGWIRIAGIAGFARITQLAVMGEYMTAHDVKIEVARDGSSTYFDSKTWTVSPASTGRELVRHGPSIQKMDMIKVRITDRTVGADTDPAGEGYKLSGLAIRVKVKQGFAALPAAQKQ